MSTPVAATETAASARRSRHQLFRFSLRGVITLIPFIAMGLALFVQHQHLSNVQAALSRYESTHVPTAITGGHFRVIAHPVLDTDHVKVMAYRIESVDEHFATLSDGHGDSNGCRSAHDPNTDLHVTEVTVLLDHVDSEDCVKMLPKVGGVQGYTVATVKDGYALDDDTTINDVDGVYSRTEKVGLFQWNGKSYFLSLK